jgi:two-component system response regulator MprA
LPALAVEIGTTYAPGYVPPPLSCGVPAPKHHRLSDTFKVPEPHSSSMAAKVLVVDDEPSVRDAVERALRTEGYRVQTAPDGEAALDVHAEFEPDALVLDILMPRIDGLDVCRSLRRSGDRTPILMLTARDAVSDRVEGLDAGADDYLVKPFALEELLARVRALLRRTLPGAEDPLRFSDLILDPVEHTVTRGEREIDLTRTEFLLLELFLMNPRRVLPREVIFDRVWGYDFGVTSNTLEVYVGYLRRKTEAAGEPRLIHTVRGVGYVLRES